MQLTLVEPSTDLANNLYNRFAEKIPHNSLRVIQSTIQDFNSSDRFDIILMSHVLYHLPLKLWPKELSKMLSLLEEDGVLVIILRDKDDAYDFKMTFKPLLHGDSFQALTIDDVLKSLPEKTTFDVEKQTAHSELRIPIDNNLEDTVSIIEFYLNKQWSDIPANIQESCLDFINKKNGKFQQIDGIVIVRNHS